MKKKNRFQKKALKATWSDDSDSSSNDEEEHVANMCFMAIESENEEPREHGEWFLDSACSRHMTGDGTLFSSLTKAKGGKVTFGDNSKGKIVGIGNIGVFYGIED
ncbi:Retrovirus-related polyprotein from transposon [Salix suchowensis]|nr:Retrovirus-related polyprotein from transposon [Salix suchowensis]